MPPLWIARIATIFMLAPIIVAFYRKKNLNYPLHIFLWYCLFSFLVNVFEHLFLIYASANFKVVEPYLIYFGINDTSFIGIVFYVLDFSLLGWFYKELLPTKSLGKKIQLVSVILMVCCLINYFFIEGYQTYGIFNPGVDAFFVFGVASFYLFYLYKSNFALPISKNPFAWISAGLIIPHIIGIFLYLTGDFIRNENYEFFQVLTSFKNIFHMTGQLLMAIGFWNAPYAKYITLPDEK
jgi:hypothetical protein